MKTRNADISVDYKNSVVCIKDTDLLETGGRGDQRCFAYSGAGALDKVSEAQKKVLADQALFAASLSQDMRDAKAEVSVSLSDGSTRFDADRLFRPGTADLSDEGRQTVDQLAASLARRLPCLAYGVAVSDCTGQTRVSAVMILGVVNIDAFTPEGRAAQSLALERSVAFHQALLAAQPVLGQLRNQPQGGEPLLRVGSVGTSQANVAAEGTGKAIAVQFQMADLPAS
ncbi:MAG: hypothetical protein QM667_08150 [Asticcacaulis sp.]